ncbi:uncharacterized protein TNIN_335641 [Trichonephila inaurata madagascariensis]|uniref:DUF382 domain-containing protein n=1 Tax=Trichonephila inaurata madagascariensis TaxID=2747483 RepID=A0A8X6WQH5_9ARAC|nr:uncharacterized protein TNIN_335641 [Trichonephila inaurata madagascariensis]
MKLKKKRQNWLRENSKKLSRMTVAKLQQTVDLKASSNMLLIPQYWSFRREYSQDKRGKEKLAWKLRDFIKRDGTMKIRQSSRETENRDKKRVRLKFRTHDNISRDGKARDETRPLDCKVFDPEWREYFRELDTRKWTFVSLPKWIF